MTLQCAPGRRSAPTMTAYVRFSLSLRPCRPIRPPRASSPPPPADLRLRSRGPSARPSTLPGDQTRCPATRRREPFHAASPSRCGFFRSGALAGLQSTGMVNVLQLACSLVSISCCLSLETLGQLMFYRECSHHMHILHAAQFHPASGIAIVKAYAYSTCIKCHTASGTATCEGLCNKPRMCICKRCSGFWSHLSDASMSACRNLRRPSCQQGSQCDSKRQKPTARLRSQPTVALCSSQMCRWRRWKLTTQRQTAMHCWPAPSNASMTL